MRSPAPCPRLAAAHQHGDKEEVVDHVDEPRASAAFRHPRRRQQLGEVSCDARRGCGDDDLDVLAPHAAAAARAESLQDACRP